MTVQENIEHAFVLESDSTNGVERLTNQERCIIWPYLRGTWCWQAKCKRRGARFVWKSRRAISQGTKSRGRFAIAEIRVYRAYTVHTQEKSSRRPRQAFRFSFWRRDEMFPRVNVHQTQSVWFEFPLLKMKESECKTRVSSFVFWRIISSHKRYEPRFERIMIWKKIGIKFWEETMRSIIIVCWHTDKSYIIRVKSDCNCHGKHDLVIVWKNSEKADRRRRGGGLSHPPSSKRILVDSSQSQLSISMTDSEHYCTIQFRDHHLMKLTTWRPPYQIKTALSTMMSWLTNQEALLLSLHITYIMNAWILSKWKCTLILWNLVWEAQILKPTKKIAWNKAYCKLSSSTKKKTSEYGFASLSLKM